MKRRRGLPKRPRQQLDVSLAIVNIVLLLIFFFLATGRLLNPAGPGLDLSETTELPLDALPKPVLVVGQAGRWELDGAPLDPNLLDAALQDMPQPVTLHLLIDRGAPADSLLAVVARPELEEVEVRLVTLRRRVEQ
ncbi:ExbD/TolR family protein [Jannaschia aquimarina]|uniref:Biopolymer transport protein ExbD/TolR n=1 Tax=Jannaschia aquimarina TaxID=935700 RepID=A0A0D1CT20_9RHOB|nr:biopolymer transporter ExbD [Jannaschia aquimarina]KIT17912.1 Biopolymer transport protein ExbD/TolR [Jannaschia aquimarina]SNT23612.1 biopolymer transport protein ExbD [Jannaschia aquimarina]